MVIFGSSPADAYDVEVTPWAALQAYQAADDQEHWSSGVSLVDKTCEEEDGLCGEEEDDGEAGLRATCSSTGTPVRLRLQEEGGRERGLRVGVGVGRSDVAGHGEMRESRPAITAIDLHATRHELHARVASGASGGTGRTRQRVGCQRVGAGPLGTDGDVLRGHFCKVCNSYVVRSDHHCPFLGVCVGAHNQAYFIAMLFQMVLAMLYATAISGPAAVSCFMHKADGGGVMLSDERLSTSVQAGRLAVEHGAKVGQVQGALRGGALVQTRFAGAWTEQCVRVVPIALAIMFVAIALCVFWGMMFYLTALNLTLREALSLDILRYKVGPLRVWGMIRANTCVADNIADVLGGSGVLTLASLVVPMRRRVAAFRPLDLPSEESLSAPAGVYWAKGM